YLLRHRELALQGEVERLPAGAVDCVASNVAEGEGGGCRERRGVEPTVGGVRAGVEDGLARVVGAHGVLAQKRPGVGRVAEYRDRQRESALRLEDGRHVPASRKRVRQFETTYRGQVVDGAQCEAVAYVAGGALLKREVA